MYCRGFTRIILLISLPKRSLHAVSMLPVVNRIKEQEQSMVERLIISSSVKGIIFCLRHFRCREKIPFVALWEGKAKRIELHFARAKNK